MWLMLMRVGLVATWGLAVLAVNFHHLGVELEAVLGLEVGGRHHTELEVDDGCHHGQAVVPGVVVDCVDVVDGVDGVKLQHKITQ